MLDIIFCYKKVIFKVRSSRIKFAYVYSFFQLNKKIKAERILVIRLIFLIGK